MRTQKEKLRRPPPLGPCARTQTHTTTRHVSVKRNRKREIYVRGDSSYFESTKKAQLSEIEIILWKPWNPTFSFKWHDCFRCNHKFKIAVACKEVLFLGISTLRIAWKHKLLILSDNDMDVSHMNHSLVTLILPCVPEFYSIDPSGNGKAKYVQTHSLTLQGDCHYSETWLAMWEQHLTCSSTL